MRFPLSFLMLLLLVATGCPLDIQVREALDAGCSGDACVLSCAADRECPEDQRCSALYEECEPGPRLTEPCFEPLDCPTYTYCVKGRCSRDCERGCPTGYQCSPAPESLCVETCEGLSPEHLGDSCETSMDCARCGFCTDSGQGRRCHQPCRSDAECPGAKPGGCVLIPGSSLRVCQQ
ncbi:MULTISPECIES: latent transforming growth factor beta-binding protein [unclassified Corallococcus]|uniref:latent transforming growth factor beta-binding protein n=1 Tax=unclassified Corallococcus TaxID=2685029 RepID=UPI001A8D6F15|nr:MULTISPECIES: latent transforming growth factor beta-binding protein [unclassified Corallococcus]MBN9685702.1 latent transforming growth factor beta-binding protein [Corallococcus sp. NCSPR001]WAS82853.1 latent transforming growth factor beta-binding protein [Corallococcus sp. NCRR]